MRFMCRLIVENPANLQALPQFPGGPGTKSFAAICVTHRN